MICRSPSTSTRRSVVGAALIAALLLSGCSGGSGGSNGAISPTTFVPTVLPTVGSQSAGGLSYTWHQVFTSPGSTPSIYDIHVNAGWVPGKSSADVIAVYIADKVDLSSGADAPLTLSVDCAASGQPLASGTYIRNDGGPDDVTWSSYTDLATSCR